MLEYFREIAEQLLLEGTKRENSPKKLPDSISFLIFLSSSSKMPTFPSSIK